MDLSRFVDKVCKLELTTGFFYKGTIKKVTDNEIFLIDRTGNEVCISPQIVTMVREVKTGFAKW